MGNIEKDILFNKFEIIKCYKKDEYSAVYLANHIFLEKKVFLKILNTQTIPDPNLVERFKLEAKILAKLDHPNIIKVFDFGTSKDYFYISFEYFASQNLREFFQKGDINEYEKKEIVIQILKGLDYVHSNKILHRDIKPENILVNEKIEVKLTDFGLAQISNDQMITQKFSVVGTPAYMSPEQINGLPLTVKSDLFSLGITIFEIYSGKNPFFGNSANETINNIISFNERTIQSKYDKFPEVISKILKGLLVSEPESRFDSVSECLNIFGISHYKTKRKISKKAYYVITLPIIIGSFALFYIIFTYISEENGEIQIPISENPIDDSLSNAPNDEVVIDLKDSVVKEPTNLSQNNVSSELILDDNITDSANIEKAGENSILLTKGEIYIKCYPWADIHLNDKYIETTPLSQNITTDPGIYVLNLLHPNYPPCSDTIQIYPSELYSLEINLDTLFGFLDCQVYPWGEIHLNGEKKGVTPLEFPIPLVPGNYDLEVKNPKFNKISSSINISRKDTLRLKFNLTEIERK